MPVFVLDGVAARWRQGQSLRLWERSEGVRIRLAAAALPMAERVAAGGGAIGRNHAMTRAARFEAQAASAPAAVASS